MTTDKQPTIVLNSNLRKNRSQWVERRKPLTCAAVNADNFLTSDTGKKTIQVDAGDTVRVKFMNLICSCQRI